MNVFNKVTLESLKKNRTRTIVTIIGIMLSAAMICASTTLVSSMQNFVLRCAIHIDGDWYGAVYDAAYKDYEDIRDSDRVSSAAYAQVLGYAKIDSANERKPYLYVLGGDVASGYFKTMPVHLILLNYTDERAYLQREYAYYFEMHRKNGGAPGVERPPFSD